MKKYTKPEIKKTALNPEESVLFNCMGVDIFGPMLTGCVHPVPCRETYSDVHTCSDS